MTNKDYIRITAQLAVLRDVLEEYNDRTLSNAIQTLESRKKWYEEHQNEETL